MTSCLHLNPFTNSIAKNSDVRCIERTSEFFVYGLVVQQCIYMR